MSENNYNEFPHTPPMPEPATRAGSTPPMATGGVPANGAPVPPDGKPKKKGFSAGSFMGGLLCGIAITSIICVAIVSVAVYNLIANLSGTSDSSSDSSISSIVEILTGSSDTFLTDDVIDKLELIESIIDAQYSLGDISDEEFADALYYAMLDVLGDEYSVYYNEEDYQALLEYLYGETFYGIGVYVSMDSDVGLPRISSVIAGGSAEELGLRANDYIYAVEGECIAGYDLDTVVDMIRGEENTQVTITMLRDGEYFDVTATRKEVTSAYVYWYTTEEEGHTIGYIEITQFAEASTDQFAQALEEVTQAGAEGLILDLRANPGGTLDSVVAIAQMILPEGLIVYTEDKSGYREEYYSSGENELQIPMVVLVDMNSASASEVLAGAIKDYGIGTLVGTTTYGKGIVQHVISLYDGTAIKLTTSNYYTPLGNFIHGIGVEPDVYVEFDSEAYYAEDPVDNQYQAALEELLKMIE